LLVGADHKLLLLNSGLLLAHHKLLLGPDNHLLPSVGASRSNHNLLIWIQAPEQRVSGWQDSHFHGFPWFIHYFSPPPPPQILIERLAHVSRVTI